MADDSPSLHHPCLAIVGRPNVGKSTLFNRLIGRRKAVVSPARGTTRDRLFGEVVWRGVALTLIDTGGVDFAAEGELAEAVQRHIGRALREADGVLLVCDAKEGLVPADELVMAHLRKTGKPVVLVVNKADERVAVPSDFFALGVASPLAVSALHGRGTGDLLDRLVEECGGPAASSATPLPEAPARAFAVAIVGRQNVGKSSLLNALLREDRVIVSETPGTTRDAVDTRLTVNGTPVTLIDTAGLRHRRKVTNPVDFFAMSRAADAIARCDVALLVLDAAQGVTSDDRRILAKVRKAGCGLILLANKWDLVRGVSAEAAGEAVRRAVPFVAFAPALAVSAKTNFQVPRILPLAVRVGRSLREGLSDAECTTVLERLWAARPLPRSRGRVIRLKGARWIDGRPPRVGLAVAPAGRLPLAYEHYLLKRLRAHPRLTGVPVGLVMPGAGARQPSR